MRMYLLSDNVDTLIGMRLSGVEGVVVHEEKEILDALSDVMNQEDVAVVLITQMLMKKVRDTVYDLKLNRARPLIIEIPDRHGAGGTKDSITEYVQDAIGLKLD